MVDVHNLATGCVVTYDAASPEEAVERAYRQFTMGDQCWWNYAARPLSVALLRSERVVACGDWCARRMP